MKIFLTGHKGFIGSHLMNALFWDGRHIVKTDMKDFGEKHDLIIHLAARTHIRADFDAEIFNSNILFAHKMLSTPYPTIYASSCSAAHLTNPYAYTKRYNEWLGAKHGNALGLRFHNVYGPGNNKGIVKYLMDQPTNSGLTIRGPELIRDYIHVDDVIRSIMALVNSGFVPGIMDMGTGIGTKTIDLVNLYQRLSDKKFVLDFGEHGRNEPKTMISNCSIQGFISLEGGLKKLIENPH